MTQTSRVWDGTTTGDATTAPYDAATEFSKVLMSISGAAGIPTNLSGVFRSELNELVTTGVATPVSTNSGRALVWGTWFESDAAVTTAIPTPSASTRIDRIVLRKDWAAQTVRITRIAGVEGGGAPALTQVAATTWDEPIAQVSITTGGVITVTDQRQFLGGSSLLDNIDTVAVGDLLVADTTTTLARLADVATGRVLVSGGIGALPAWSSTPTIAGNVTGQGGLGFIAQPAGGVALRVYGGATGHQWDMYLSGNNIRFSDNTGSGLVAVDTAMTVGGTITSGRTGGEILGATFTTSNGQIRLSNTGGNAYFGTDGSIGSGFASGGMAYAASIFHDGPYGIQFGTNNLWRVFIDSSGRVGVGGTPNAYALLDLQSTLYTLMLPRMTTTQKNAMTAVNGMIVYDSTLNKFQGYEAGSWNNFSVL